MAPACPNAIQKVYKGSTGARALDVWYVSDDGDTCCRFTAPVSIREQTWDHHLSCLADVAPGLRPGFHSLSVEDTVGRDISFDVDPQRPTLTRANRETLRAYATAMRELGAGPATIRVWLFHPLPESMEPRVQRLMTEITTLLASAGLPGAQPAPRSLWRTRAGVPRLRIALYVDRRAVARGPCIPGTTLVTSVAPSTELTVKACQNERCSEVGFAIQRTTPVTAIGRRLEGTLQGGLLLTLGGSVPDPAPAEPIEAPSADHYRWPLEVFVPGAPAVGARYRLEVRADVGAPVVAAERIIESVAGADGADECRRPRIDFAPL